MTNQELSSIRKNAVEQAIYDFAITYCYARQIVELAANYALQKLNNGASAGMAINYGKCKCKILKTALDWDRE